jgi:hypothetical protein
MKKGIFTLIILSCLLGKMQAAHILMPMDLKQKEHLKAYGITYWVLKKEFEAHWLLNYRGGSFVIPHRLEFEKECKTRGVSYEVISDAQFADIQRDIQNPESNMEDMKLEVAPKIAVYTPDVDAKGKALQPWDDAVTLVLAYAEIPFEKVYDREVLEGNLTKYDWLHLHHEDFTGQYGRFYSSHGSTQWYRENQRKAEELSLSLGFIKVSQCKLAVTKKVKEFVSGGGFMFAMCSAADSYDIALAAEGTDICAAIFDGDAADPNAQAKLDFSKTFAFQDFQLIRDPMIYEFSSIDNSMGRSKNVNTDYFTLFDFSAKWDPIPTMLTQNHTKLVKGFMGQTTAFKKQYIKPTVLTLGEAKPYGESRYIHGVMGEGFFTFYGGHDPEDYEHRVTDPETDLSLHPNSPGYRLILNNILFPAAKKKKKKT